MGRGAMVRAAGGQLTILTHDPDALLESTIL